MKNKDRYNLKKLKVNFGTWDGVDLYDGDNHIAHLDTYDGLFWWLEQEYSILTDSERAYLSAVIKPWRLRVKSIVKQERLLMELIVIKCRDRWDVELPNFERGTMYQGMELNKEYSLEDLGL